MSPLEKLFTTKEAAEYLGVSEAHLGRMRCEGCGPSFCRIGKRRVGYRACDLSEWLESRVVTSSDDARERGLAARGGFARQQ